jgi:hypothetical protein
MRRVLSIVLGDSEREWHMHPQIYSSPTTVHEAPSTHDGSGRTFLCAGSRLRLRPAHKDLTPCCQGP